MKPLIVLLISFGIAVFAIEIFTQHNDYAFAARIAMSVTLVYLHLFLFGWRLFT